MSSRGACAVSIALAVLGAALFIPEANAQREQPREDAHSAATTPTVTPPPPARDPAFDTNCGTEYRMDEPEYDRTVTPPRLVRHGAMEGIPVIQQAGGNCYAAAVAGAVDAYRFEHGDTDRSHFTSDIWTAVAMNSASGESGAGLHNFARFTCETANAIMHDPNVGSCRRSDVLRTARPENFHTLAGEEVGEGWIYWTIQNRYNEYQAYKKARWGKNFTTERAFEISQRRRFIAQSIVTCARLQGQPGVPLPDLAAIEPLLDDANPLRLLRTTLEPSCRAHLKTNMSYPGQCNYDSQPSVQTDSAPNVANRLRNLLNSNHRAPVMISYCTAALDARRGDRFRVNRPGNPACPAKPPCSDTVTSDCGDAHCECGHHASLVIGQRRDPATGKCQFLVRNSWGTGCGRYADGDFGASPAYCDNGNIWIDARELAGNMESMSRITP